MGDAMIDTFFAIWSEEPALVLGFFASLLVAAYLFAFGAKIRVRHKQKPSVIDAEWRAIQAEMDREHAARRKELDNIARIEAYRNRRVS
jgi:hypothetical protein